MSILTPVIIQPIVRSIVRFIWELPAQPADDGRWTIPLIRELPVGGGGAKFYPEIFLPAAGGKALNFFFLMGEGANGAITRNFQI